MKSYNVKIIFKTEEDKQKLLKTLSLQRDAWNIASTHRFGMKNGEIKVLHDLSYYDIKNKIQTLPSQYIIKSIRDVIAAYTTIKSNRVKLDEAASKKQLSCHLDKRLFNWRNKERTTFSITTYNKRVTCSIEYYDKLKEFSLSDMIDPSIFVKGGEIYLTLIFDEKQRPLFKESTNSVGIDLGIRRIFSTSKGDILKDKKSLKIKRKIRFLKRILQAKSTLGSKSSRKHLIKLKRKEQNFNKNWTHNVVNKALSLNNDCSTFVIEDLKGVKRTKGYKKQGNMKSQWNPFEFRRILTYKAQALNKRVVTVKPYLTSQLDHRGQVGGIRIGCRYKAGDGVMLDADVNAAINILNKYLKHPNSCLTALDGQVRVNGPYERDSLSFKSNK
jgi:IS605 OrfB family transposase